MTAIEFEPHGERSLRMTLAGAPTVEQVLHALRDDTAFRATWTRSLAELPFTALRWETPRMTTDSLDDPFEAIVIDSPALARRQDASAFAELFDAQPDADVITAPNLGGDALMIIPAPRTQTECYCHLAAFLRGAPAVQCDALWESVARATLDRLGSKPLWLNIAGGGVAWLHVRVDDRPKYYVHAAYRGC